MLKTKKIILLWLAACLIMVLNLLCFFVFVRNGRKRNKIVLPVLAILLSFVCMLSSSAYLISDINLKHAGKVYMETLVAIFTFLSFLGGIFFAVKDCLGLRNEITNNSLIEALDNMNSGLIFFDHDGTPFFCNKKMNEIGIQIMGESPNDGQRFWHSILNNGSIIDADGLQLPSFRMEDGSVWMFSFQHVFENEEMVYVVRAIEATSIYEISNELIKKNNILKEVNEKLRKYNESVTELTRSEEILRAKRQIHDDLGQALLFMSRYTKESNSSEEFEKMRLMWLHNIALLKRQAKPDKNEIDPVEQIVKAGKAIGVDVQVKGNIPENALFLKIFNFAIRESIINAVNYAGADKLFVTLDDYVGGISIIITNNGKQPKEPIVERGGLKNLRDSVESKGGSMQVSAESVFILKINLPI